MVDPQKKAGKKQPAKKKEGQGKDLVTKIKEEVKKHALNAHHSFFKDLPFGLKMFLSILVDGIDMLLGFLPGVSMVGTTFTVIAGLVLWGDIGFLAAWEFLPELAGFMTTVGTAGLSHVVAVAASLIPSTTICGLVWRYQRRHGTGIATQKRFKKSVVVKRQIRPEVKEIGADIKDYFCNLEVRPEIKQTMTGAKDYFRNLNVRSKVKIFFKKIF